MMDRGVLFSINRREAVGFLVGVAVVVMIVASGQLTVWAIPERAVVTLFPGGTVLPLTVIRDEGPPGGIGPLILSRSIEGIRQELERSIPYCRVPAPAPSERGWEHACWRDVRQPPGSLLIGTISPDCSSYERLAVLSGETLRIRVVDQCPGPAPGAGALPTAGSTLLAVPLDRLPRGRLTVILADDRAPSATASINTA